MSRGPRLLYPDAFYHVFNRGADKHPIVLDDRDRKTFLSLLGKTVSIYCLRLFCYCLMDNHYHLYVQTPLGNLDKALQFFQGQFANYFNKRYSRMGVLFQSRYKSPIVETESYSFALARYIHWNPIEAGRVKKIEDYAWSSYPCYIGIFPAWDWLNTEWLLAQFHKDRRMAIELFKAFHQIKPPAHEIEQIEKMTPILGDPDYLSALALKPQKGSDPKGPNWV